MSDTHAATVEKIEGKRIDLRIRVTHPDVRPRELSRRSSWVADVFWSGARFVKGNPLHGSELDMSARAMEELAKRLFAKVEVGPIKMKEGRGYAIYRIEVTDPVYLTGLDEGDSWEAAPLPRSMLKP